jgi:hypothetical protein
MVASYSGLVEFAGGATTVVDIDDLDEPAWRGTPRRLFLNHANPPPIWLVGVHLLEGPRAGQYANADIHQETPPFFIGREPFGEAPPNVVPRNPLSTNPAPRVVNTQSLCPRCGGHRYIQLTTSHSCCNDCGLGRVSQPLRLETSSPPIARARPSSPERERVKGASQDTLEVQPRPSSLEEAKLPCGHAGGSGRCYRGRG